MAELTEQNWTNGSGGGTPLSSTRLNNVEKRITVANKTRLSDFYRPLQGITSIVTETNTSTWDSDGTAIEWASLTNKVRFCGVKLEAYSSDSTQCLNDANGFAQPSENCNLPITMEFYTNSSFVGVEGYSTNRADVWALVDDMKIRGDWLHYAASASNFNWRGTLPAAGWHKWRICVSGRLRRLRLSTGAKIAPTAPTGPQIAVVSASGVQGNVAIGNAIPPSTTGYITAGVGMGEFEMLTGLDIYRAAVWGSNYLTHPSYGTDGKWGSSRRMTALAELPGIDVVIAYGGLNDGTSNVATLESEAIAAWTAMKAAQPTAKLVVIGFEPIGTANSVFASYKTRNDALVAAARAHASVDQVFDPYNDWQYMSGSGYEGSEANNGNQDVFVSNDGLHGTHVGNRAQAIEFLFGQLGQIKL